MPGFQPTRRMLQLQERFDGLGSQIVDLMRAEIGRVLDRMAGEFSGHDIEYYCGMGSLGLSISPPLVSENGERVLDSVVYTVDLVGDVMQWYDDHLQKLFVQRAFEIFDIDAWLCGATRCGSSELGSIVRGTKNG